MERTYGSEMNAIIILGHTGGLAYFGYILLLFLLRPISEYSFHLKAARQLFFARTSYDNLFKYSYKTEEEKNQHMAGLTNSEMSEIEFHREIHISNYKRCCLFFVHCIRHILKNCCCNCIPKKYQQLLFLKDTIKKRMREDLDVVDILKKLRELQVIVDNSKIDENVRFKINHSYNNVINLEDADQY